MSIGNDRQLNKIREIGNLEVDKDEIKKVSKRKYLGLKIDKSLFWSKKCKIVNGELKVGLREILPQSQLFLFYQL